MRMLLIVLACGGVARADDFVDVHAWVVARGASDASLAANRDRLCQEVSVGPKREVALQCMDEQSVVRPVKGGDEPAVKNLFSVALLVVRGKQLVTLIDVPVKADVQDPIVRPINQPAPPWHPFTIAQDGLSIAVGDPGDAAACPAATPYPAPKTEDERVWNALSVELQRRICDARGAYLWRDGRFSRAPRSRR